MLTQPKPGEAEDLFQTLIADLRSSRKYRHLDIPEETLRDLLTQEALPQRSHKEVIKAVREKLHNIVAPYLGDPDYHQAAEWLNQAFEEGSDCAVQAVCLQLLQSHASTQERIPLMDQIYPALWAVTGKPTVLLDLACGLHPFSLPWMGLDKGVEYLAYDIHKARIDLIDQFFQLFGQAGKAFHKDILVNPPQISADVALFFKEAHRFEQRQRGCNLAFWRALDVRWLVVSLPSTSLSGSRSLAIRQRSLVTRILKDDPWPVTELEIGNEIFFCIKKK